MSRMYRVSPVMLARAPVGPDKGTWYYVWCPGCERPHALPTPRWTFNGNVSSPTFSPSFLLTAPPTDYRCHFHITDGQFRFCDDCNHALRSVSVALPDIYHKWLEE